MANPVIKIVRRNLSEARITPAKRDRRSGQSDEAGKVEANAASKTPHSDALTMTAAEVGRELQVSTKSINRMHAAGRLPTPIVVGARSLRWARKKIIEWMNAGCPDRVTFEGAQNGDASWN